MKTATFYCTKCSYTQKTAAENADKQYSCPKCGTVAYAYLNNPDAPPAPPKADSFFDAKAKIATAADAAKGAASKAAVAAGTTVTSAMEKTRSSPSLANAGAKLSQAFSKATSSVAATATAVTARAKDAANNENFAQSPQAEATSRGETSRLVTPGNADFAPRQQAAPGPSPQQGMTDRQLSAAMLAASMQRKSLGIGLLLTFFFGGLGTLYASVGWGVFFIILEFLLWAIAFFTLGLALPAIFIFHILCLVFVAVSISNHNKRLLKLLGGM